MAINHHAARVEALMLQCRRDEKDFLLRLDLTYVEQHRLNVAAWEIKLVDCSQCVPKSNEVERVLSGQVHVGKGLEMKKIAHVKSPAMMRGPSDHGPDGPLQAVFVSPDEALQWSMT